MIEILQSFLGCLYAQETVVPHIVSIESNPGVLGGGQLGGGQQCIDILTGEELSVGFSTPYPVGATVSFLSRGGVIFVMHAHDPAQQAESGETNATNQDRK